ncbi:MAG: RNB domain-containing ribonuclease [Deltaproteobacteria bacterium]|nr:RNB domain-containing ribonuclease [Deltaproteobacteria bacterium]
MTEPNDPWVARVEGDQAVALVGGEKRPFAGRGRNGAVVLVRADGSRARVVKVLAEPGTATATLHEIAGSSGVTVVYPESVLREVAAIERAPSIDDASLRDQTDVPYVTIDAPTSRDLDQAIWIGETRGGWNVRYAIADAAHFVPRTSALWAEALARGASYYMPGLSIPMLPRALSEDLVSLGPSVERRALVFDMELDSGGHCLSTTLVRSRIRSRAKLSFADVQQLVDDPASSALRGSPMEPSLRALRDVGRARLREAAERDVVRYRRREMEVRIGGAGDGAGSGGSRDAPQRSGDAARLAGGAEGTGFVVLDSVRNEVELWNEQISLLCNGEGARLLREAGMPWVQPVYRVHEAPDPERVASLRSAIATIAEVHRLDSARWQWDESQSLALYVARLPADGPHARIARAIQRQAILVNVRSTYATQPAIHHGVGLEPYARFSAPMREIVGIYLHGEAMQLLARPAERGDEEAIRAAVVEAANRSKATQRKITDLVNRRVIDSLFSPELRKGRNERTTWTGTVMGVSGGKLHVQLDSPGIDVKIYLRDAGRVWRSWLVPDELGVVLRDRDSGQVRVRVGDAIDVRVADRDATYDRWVLEPVGPVAAA